MDRESMYLRVQGSRSLYLKIHLLWLNKGFLE
jgi:hypothetical protein